LLRKNKEEESMTTTAATPPQAVSLKPLAEYLDLIQLNDNTSCEACIDALWETVKTHQDEWINKTQQTTAALKALSKRISAPAMKDAIKDINALMKYHLLSDNQVAVASYQYLLAVRKFVRKHQYDLENLNETQINKINKQLETISEIAEKYNNIMQKHWWHRFFAWLGLKSYQPIAIPTDLQPTTVKNTIKQIKDAIDAKIQQFKNNNTCEITQENLKDLFAAINKSVRKKGKINFKYDKPEMRKITEFFTKYLQQNNYGKAIATFIMPHLSFLQFCACIAITR
jgi:hypothetical protein